MKRIRKKTLCIVIVCVLVAALVAGAVVYFAVILPQRREQERVMQMLEQYSSEKVEVYQQENETLDDYEVEVAFVGDSLTEGYDLNKYYPQYITANRGISGDTSFGLEKRLQVSVYDLRPRVVVMLIGANNVDTMMDNYESILKGLKENLPDSDVVLLSLTAMGGEYWGRNNQFAVANNVEIERLAQEYGFSYVDLYTPLYDESIGEVYAGYTTDGGHLTDKGYEVITAQITPVLKKLLGK